MGLACYVESLMSRCLVRSGGWLVVWAICDVFQRERHGRVLLLLCWFGCCVVQPVCHFYQREMVSFTITPQFLELKTVLAVFRHSVCRHLLHRSLVLTFVLPVICISKASQSLLRAQLCGWSKVALFLQNATQSMCVIPKKLDTSRLFVGCNNL